MSSPSPAYKYELPNVIEIRDDALYLIREAHLIIARLIANDPVRAFEYQGPAHKRETRNVDSYAENNAIDHLLQLYGNTVEIYGEEKLAPDSRKAEINLEGLDKLVVLVDMVDGTDLLVRGFANWCSAVIFFHPKSETILGAFVGIPVVSRFGYDVRLFKKNERGWRKALLPPDIYFALDGHPPARLPSIGEFPTEEEIDFNELASPAKTVMRPSGEVVELTLQDAAVCFYGQKARSLLKATECASLRHGLESIPPKSEFRVYNFAGNPMMVRLANGENVHAVVELSGQYPHDFVAGAYIAKRAGAILLDRNGNEITYERLAKCLLKPAVKDPATSSYILAGTQDLAEQLVMLLRRHDEGTSLH